MTLRTKTVAASAGATLALALVASAQPALARWTFHSNDGEEITAPQGGTRAQTCTGRLKAVSVWRTFVDVDNGEDPAAFQISASARAAVHYEVWKAPPGIGSFDSAREDDGVYFEDADGTHHRATLVARVTTPRRAPLPTPLPELGTPNASGNFVFTSAPISVRLRGVAPEDTLGLRPTNQAGFVSVTAMDCRLPVLPARVDVLPGSRANTVDPTDAEELLPVRIFGSSRLRVRRINTVHLGEAAPASVPPALQPSLQPRDVNGDGRPDRLYYFRQRDTDVTCFDTSVKVTGETSNHRYFQGRNPITTAGCHS